MDEINNLIGNITCAKELEKRLHLSEKEAKQIDAITHVFPMSITNYYFSLIDKQCFRNDPIARMSVPSSAENTLSGSFDTSGEKDNTVLMGLQHKYQQTALIIVTNKCAMYCRHCFRKRMVGVADQEKAPDLRQINTYLTEHTEINNVLLTGGDALLVSNNTLGNYLDNLSRIDHLDFIRIGTRIPVVYPQRIFEDAELLELLANYCKKKRIYVVTQFNHPREITRESIQAIDALLKAGIMVRNQTVLLRGVNDQVVVLGELLRRLTKVGVIPYYIFQCRPVRGVKNQFQVPLIEGCDIVENARSMQNGVGKGLRYCMSHITGKIEIVGKMPNSRMIFKYHEAKDMKNNNLIFEKYISDSQAWIE